MRDKQQQQQIVGIEKREHNTEANLNLKIQSIYKLYLPTAVMYAAML